MIYDCRCGEEIHITTTAAAAAENNDDDDNNIMMDNRLVDCQGCCFVYRIVKK